VSTLRGAGVAADAGRVGRVAIGLVLLALAVLVVVLVVAGIEKNSHITELRQHGVPVDATVTGCFGLLGGSGSNPVGFSCHGSFVVDGHRYAVGLPGDRDLPPGTRVAGVTVLGDPSLFTTRQNLATEQASDRVFVLPAILLVVLGLLGGGLWLLRRRSRARR
jgi:hypothetical protein